MIQEQKKHKCQKKKAYTKGNLSEQYLYNFTNINIIINEIIYSQRTENISMLIEC